MATCGWRPRTRSSTRSRAYSPRRSRPTRRAAVFFDSLGRILERAGEVLRTDVRAEVDDVFVVQQIDAIALIVSEVGAAWSELFGALERVNGVLGDTLSRAGGALSGD